MPNLPYSTSLCHKLMWVRPGELGEVLNGNKAIVSKLPFVNHIGSFLSTLRDYQIHYSTHLLLLSETINSLLNPNIGVLNTGRGEIRSFEYRVQILIFTKPFLLILFLLHFLRGRCKKIIIQYYLCLLVNCIFMFQVLLVYWVISILIQK